MLVDSHCHLDLPELAGRMPEVREAMQQHGVTHALLISIKASTYPNVRALSEAYDNFWATVGVHPDEAEETEASESIELSFERLCAEAAHPKIIGIGETGLDYHWHTDQPEWQRERFRTHIRAARASGVPLVIHTRAAAEDTVRILREESAQDVGGVMHCFSETWDIAQAALDLGFYISFSGIVTFKNAAVMQDVAQRVPLDRLLVETDAPYLTPVPFRGKKPNEPAFVRYVAEKIAALRGCDVDTIAAATSENFFRLFTKARS